MCCIKKGDIGLMLAFSGIQENIHSLCGIWIAEGRGHGAEAVIYHIYISSHNDTCIPPQYILKCDGKGYLSAAWICVGKGQLAGQLNNQVYSTRQKDNGIPPQYILKC